MALAACRPNRPRLVLQPDPEQVTSVVAGCGGGSIDMQLEDPSAPILRGISFGFDSKIRHVAPPQRSVVHLSALRQKDLPVHAKQSNRCSFSLNPPKRRTGRASAAHSDAFPAHSSAWLRAREMAV
jgi:hypothetical protein